MKKYAIYLISTVGFPCLLLSAIEKTGEGNPLSVFFLAGAVFLLYIHIKMSKKAFLKDNSNIRTVIPDCSNCQRANITYTSIVQKNQSCTDYRKKSGFDEYNSDEKTFSNTSTPTGEKRITADILTIRTREYVFDSSQERNVYYALTRKLNNFYRIDYHSHLNEVFTIINSDIRYFNDLWTNHIDFVVRDKEQISRILCCVEVDFYESNYNNERVIEVNKWKDSICKENRIPILRLQRADVLNLNVYDESTYPVSLIMLFDSLKRTTH